MEQIVVYIFPKEELKNFLLRQLSSFFPPLSAEEYNHLNNVWEKVISKCEYNFSKSDNKYFSKIEDGKRVVRFDPYHSVQWMTFLYYLSHELYLDNSSLCDKVYYLNKIMHSVDLFYAIELPQIFSAEHPLASVMERAKYGEGFFFYQGCTVGGTSDKEGNNYYPVLDDNVRMYANSSILGRCHIGRNVQIGAGALVKNQDVPDNCIVFGHSPNLIIKQAH